MKSLVHQVQHLELNPHPYWQQVRLWNDSSDLVISSYINYYHNYSVVCYLYVNKNLQMHNQLYCHLLAQNGFDSSQSSSTVLQAWRVKSTNFSAHNIFAQRNFMLHFLIISHHNISLQCFSWQQKNAENSCVRPFYSFFCINFALHNSVLLWYLLEMSRGARGWQVSLTILYSKKSLSCFGSFFDLTSQ